MLAAVFAKMLKNGNLPDDWKVLKATAVEMMLNFKILLKVGIY